MSNPGIEYAWGGEIFVPKIASYKIGDVAKAVAPNLEHRVIGIRPGEKIHEEMITHSDSFHTYDMGKYYAIIPTIPNWNIDDYVAEFSAIKVKEGFEYNSNDNTEWETPESLRELIKLHVDPAFQV